MQVTTWFHYFCKGVLVLGTYGWYHFFFIHCIHSHMVRFLWDCGQERGSMVLSFIHLKQYWLVYISISHCCFRTLLLCIQQWHNTLPALDLCLNNLATKLPWDMLYAGRLNPFMTGMEKTLLLMTGSLNKWRQEAVWFSFGKGALLP